MVLYHQYSVVLIQDILHCNNKSIMQYERYLVYFFQGKVMGKMPAIPFLSALLQFFKK